MISYWTPRNPFGSCTTNSSPLKFYSIPYAILTISQREQGIGVSWAIWTQTWQGGMAGCHSNVLKEPVDVIVGLFTIRFERFWSLREGADSQERPQIQGLFSKRLKTIREITSCSDSLQPCGKSWSTSFLKSYVVRKGKMMTGNKQHRFTTDLLNLLWLTKLVAKYLSKKSVDEERAEECHLLCPGFWHSLPSVSASKLGFCCLHEGSTEWKAAGLRLRRQWLMSHTLSRHQEERGSCSSVRLRTEFTDGLWITAHNHYHYWKDLT